VRDLLIRNARVWPSAYEDVIEDGSILIRDGLIRKMGRFRTRAETTLDAEGCLVMPGFIQAHVHLCQTLFRGAAEDRPLLPWLQEVIWPLEAAHDPDTLRASARLSCAELIRCGTTAIASFETVRHTDAVLAAASEMGMQGLIGHCLMDETGGYDPLCVDLDEALGLCDDWRDALPENSPLDLALAPRFALSCSERNMREAVAFARDRGMRLHTHAAEQIPEVEWVMEQTGMRNIEYLDRIGLVGDDALLAHCVHTNSAERAILRDSGTHVVHCPSANMKLGSGIAPIPEYLAAGISVAGGADGAPCNNRLDPFVEMRHAALIQKLRLGAGALPARDVVDLMTRGGARALGWDARTGSLAEGKQADLLIVDDRGFSCAPDADPAVNLVYSCNADSIRAVLIRGRIAWDEDGLAAAEEDEIFDQARAARRRLFQRAGLM
jgi:5-methylthioadenosine/S-adenosylhomocysteine deaminase